MASDVNLLQTKTSMSPRVATIDSQLRVTSYVFLIALLLFGTGVGGSFLFMRNRYEALLAQKKQYIVAIANASDKEALFLALKHRIGLVEKARSTQTSYDRTLSLVARLTDISTVGSLTVDEYGRTQTTLRFGRIEEAFGFMTRVTGEMESGTLSQLTLTSLQLNDEGIVEIVIVFVPTT